MNWRILLFFPAIALGIGLFLWQTREQPEDVVEARQTAPVAVRVVTVAAAQVSTAVSGFGRVEPQRTWEAVSQVDGRIVDVLAGLAEGVIVPEGTE